MLPSLRNDVARERRGVGPVIEDDGRSQGRIRSEQRGKVARFHAGVGHDGVLREALTQPHRFPGEEVEGLVLENRAADGSAKRVAPQFPLAIGKAVARVHPVVSQEFVQNSVNLVRAGAGHDVDVSPGLAAEFRAVVCRFDFDLLNGVDGGSKDIRLVGGLLAGHAIKQILVVSGVVPVDAERADPGGALGLMALVPGAVGDARRNQAELHEISRGQRQIDNFASLDQIADLRVVGLQHRSGGGDFDRFRHLPDLHAEIHFDGLVDIHLEGFCGGLLESSRLCRDAINTDSHSGKRIAAGVVGDGGFRGPFVDLFECDGDALHHSIAAIANRAGDAGCDLCLGQGSGKQRNKR